MKRLLTLAVALLIASPSYAQTTLGTSSSATNPERSGDATTGLFSSTTGAVSISSAGTEVMRANGTGIGIGTTSPQTLLTISKNTSGTPSVTGSGAIFQIVGADSAFSGMEMEAFGDNSTLFFVRYDGTFSSQSALLSGEAIGSIVGGGYNGSSVSSNKVGIIYAAGGNWSTSSNPTYITFGTAAVGATSKSERMRIDTTGNVGIGTTAPGNPLSVNGIVESQTGGFKFPDGTTQTTAGVSPSSNGMVLLATVNASGASSVTFGSTYITSTYNKYVIEFDSLSAGTSTEHLELQVSGDNGSTWKTTGYYYAGYGYNVSLGTVYSASNTGTYIDIANNQPISTTAHNLTSGTIKFATPSGADKTIFDYKTDGYDNSDFFFAISGGGAYNTAGSINAIKIFMQSGTISGNFHLYGLSGS